MLPFLPALHYLHSLFSPPLPSFWESDLTITTYKYTWLHIGLTTTGESRPYHSHTLSSIVITNFLRLSTYLVLLHLLPTHDIQGRLAATGGRASLGMQARGEEGGNHQSNGETLAKHDSCETNKRGFRRRVRMVEANW